MAENDWNVSNPIDHTKIGSLPEKIRDVKSSAKIIFAKEHQSPSTDNSGGQHVRGSARAFLQSGYPILDPEGNSLDTTVNSDAGRIAVNTAASNTVRVYVNTSAGVSTGWQSVRVERFKLADTGDANDNVIANVATGTQSGQAIHVGQIDTSYFKGISTGLFQLRGISTYLAASGQDGIAVLTARDAVVDAIDSYATKVTFPNGLVVQMFRFASTDDSDEDISFPEAFGTACLGVTSSIAGIHNALTTTQFTLSRIAAKYNDALYGYAVAWGY